MIQNTQRFFIGGKWVAPEGDTPFPVLNPATGEEITQTILGTEKDVNRAVAAAEAAFPAYSETTKADRLELLRRFRDISARRYEEMAQAISLELGAPITMARGQQADTGIGHLDGFIAALEMLEEEETLASGDVLRKEPIGVCALITPWNWPVNQIALKVLPALAAGCTCILKPSELTPLSAVLYAEMIEEAGFPPGTFNLIHGDGTGVGAPLTSHPDVDMVSFTGSTRAGIAIGKSAAESIKRVTLELGGKSPYLVFADADLRAAVDYAVGECMNNTGQSCDAPTRLLVERSVYDQVLKLVAAAVNAITPGDPAMEGAHVGPLVSQMQYDRVQALISAAIEEGATLLAGGPGKPDGFNRGYYARPTVFADVSSNMTIAQEEVFGPVLTVIPFDTEEEAISIANDTPYGLAAYFHTSDEAREKRLIRRLQAGMVHVNGGTFKYGTPFGGYKMSGNGREGGAMGLEDFLETKLIIR